MTTTTCDHLDFNDFFNTCNDCGEDVQLYTDCDHCHEMNIPVDDSDFDGICPDCGKEAISG